MATGQAGDGVQSARVAGERTVTYSPVTYSITGLSERDFYLIGRLLYQVGGRPYDRNDKTDLHPRGEIDRIRDTMVALLPAITDIKDSAFHGISFSGAIVVEKCGGQW